LDQIKCINTINSVYFEGGEPFLYYPLLVESARIARNMGFEVGIVTNAYWANSFEDALLWLRPLAILGIEDLSISDDAFHHDGIGESPGSIALRAARAIGIASDNICIEAPKAVCDNERLEGRMVVGGDVLFRGRAVDKLISDLPRQSFSNFKDCPHENLRAPERVHLDPFGNVHICQGISIGNINRKLLSEIFSDYRPKNHPIVGPLLSGGPAELALKYGFDVTGGFVSHCHLCFETRRSLLENFPDILTPKLVYGN
jgi:MoaA/NifB/PqqE/SkfB family radical SAM enzyme